MTEPDQRVYAGATAAERIAARRARMLDAALDLLATGGWRALNVEAVSRTAGLTKRYFYESFSTVEELGAALIGQMEDDIVAATDIRLPRGDAVREATDLSVASAQLAIGALIRYLAGDTRRARAVFVELAGSPEANRLRLGLMRNIAERVAARAREFHGVTDDRPAADLAAALLVGGTIEAFLAWLDGRVDLTVDEMIDALAEFWAVVGDRAAAMPPPQSATPKTHVCELPDAEEPSE